MLENRFRVSLDVVIRPARSDDLCPLEWWGSFSEHRTIIQAVFAAMERGNAVFLVADSGGFPIGQAWVDLKHGPTTAMLWALRVLPGLRGAGIGRRLIESCEDRIRIAGIGTVIVNVDKGNDRAQALYERLGYRLVGEYRDKYRYADPEGKPAEMDLDQWVLEKCLSSPAGGNPTAA
jgi:ribosomal protein S18 acetylase RimI-like enzyme